MFTFRDYQSEDATAVLNAHADHSAVLVRWATGLGKGVLIADLARHYSAFGRVLVLVDVSKLVWQLAGTIDRHTGHAPGIEMGDLRAGAEAGMVMRLFGVPADGRIVVGTVQTQYAKDRNGQERFKQFNPADFSCLILDECETFIADGARKVVEHYRQNPALKIVGLSATPFRTDGKGMGRLFDFAAEGAGPLNRDLLWGRDNGWLVPAMQGFVRVSVDFSTLELKRRDDGERDYSDEQIAERLMSEQPMVELAKGIVDQAGDRRALVVCPNVECAVAVADYLDGERKGAARCIYGELSDQQKADLFGGHQAGDFQFLTSVMMLCLDSETEILTSEGWKGIDSIRPDHEVANWEDGRVYFATPKRIVRRWRGPGEDVVSAVGRRVNIRVTGGHELIVAERSGEGWIKAPARALTGQPVTFPASGMAHPLDVFPEQPADLSPAENRRMVSYTSHQLRKKGMGEAESRVEAQRRVDRRYSLRRCNPGELGMAECMFIGFWIGDGSRTELQSGGVNYTLCQSTAYPKIIEWVDRIVGAMGVDFRREERWPPAAQKAGDKPHVLWGFPRGTGSGDQEREGIFYLEPYLDKMGSRLLWGLNEIQFDALVWGYWMADGEHGDGGAPDPDRQFVFADTKKPFLDLLQAIASVRGYRTYQTPKKHSGNDRHAPIHMLYLKKCPSYSITQTHLQSEPIWQQEEVWCAETQSGSIITRRGGRVTVMGNCKGYDDPVASVVFNCRKTRSRRLYQQIAGRVVRPLAGVVDGLLSAEQRKAAIVASGKPDALVVNMVGVDDSVRDITLVDLLGEKHSEAVRERAKRKQEQGEEDPEEALFAAEEEIEAERKEAEEKRRAERQRAKVAATVHAEYTADWSVGGGNAPAAADGSDPRFAHLSPKLAKRLLNAKVPAEDLAKMSPGTAGRVWAEITRGWEMNLRTYRQGKTLIRNGYTREEIHDMTFERASAAIDELARNNWRRPTG